MKICILQSSYEGSNSIFKSVDSYCSPAPYSRGNHIFEAVLIKKATAFQQIRELSKKGFDVFINLCDGAFDEDRAGFEVVQILEYFNLPFTGANSSFYEPSKEVMKMMAYYYGVRTPEFVFAYNDEDIEEAVERLNFPLIVKHYNGYSSIGMTEKSKCNNAEELRKEAKKMVKEFGGALIEEFIEGNEYTVLVTENPENPNEPYALLPIEEIFDSGETFKHFDLKWKEFNNIQWRACQDEKLAEELKEMSKKMFVALGGVGYGRTDMRVNSKGEAFFLEINPNCGIFYPKDEKNPDALGSADFILVHDKNFDHHKFIEHIINCALYQHRKRQKIVEVRFKPSRGYGLYANRDILEGEIVQQNEEKPHYLVTKRYVESNWKDQIKKKWFYQYAYNITNNTYIMWSDKPNDWLPINHSCDPNTWLVGLNVVARKFIKKGEQITIEYSTFITDNMEEFECNCSSSNCRKMIKKTDYLLPQMDIYIGHMSDYVEQKRKEYYHHDNKINEQQNHNEKILYNNHFHHHHHHHQTNNNITTNHT